MRIRSLTCRGAWWLRGAVLLTAWTMTPAVHAAQVNLAWDASSDPKVAGYDVLYGTQPGNYTGNVDAGMATRHTVTGLSNGKTYYFAVKAYSSGRTLESAASNEVKQIMRPIAKFGATPTSGTSPHAVSFTNNTVGTVSEWRWDFGDGNSSTAKNPTHSYSAAGIYTVKLTATGPGGAHTATKNGLISVQDGAKPPVSDFTVSKVSGITPLTVSFADASTGDVDSWDWSFGDGGVSSMRNASHTYVAPGTYTVSLTVRGPAGSNTKTLAKAVTVLPAAPAASFTSSNVSGKAPLVATFTDSTNGQVTSREWNFGDGTKGTGASVSHTYKKAGTYTVSLKVTGPGGTDTVTKTGHVKVAVAPPDASFTSSSTSGGAPLVATFTDSSQGEITSRTWNFGDGTTGTGKVAVHTYAMPGNYSVSLEVSGPGGKDSVTKAGLVKVAETPVGADFTSDITEGQAPLDVNFTDLSNGDVDTWFWDFGDGQTATTQFPIHTYQQPGNYAVTLTASGPSGGNSVTKTAYIKVSGDADGFMLSESVRVSEAWTKVDFGRTFKDPIVVAKPMNGDHRVPAVIRVRNITKTGFEIRLQGWGKKTDGIGALTASYLVMERGTHRLPNGKWIEAGRFKSRANDRRKRVELTANFKRAPIVISSVTSFRDSAPVVLRQRLVHGKNEMVVRLQEKEIDDQLHRWETVDYIAWSRSRGRIGNTRFQVNFRRKATHKLRPIRFVAPFESEPHFLADMQTETDADPANLRYEGKSIEGVRIRVAEEDSMDDELSHRYERVGYIAIARESTK